MFLPCSSATSSCAGDGIPSVNNIPLTLQGFPCRIAAMLYPQTFPACTEAHREWAVAEEKQEPINTELLGFVLIVQLGCPSILRVKNSFLLSQQCEVVHVGTGTRTVPLHCVLAVALLESKSAGLLIYQEVLLTLFHITYKTAGSQWPPHICPSPTLNGAVGELVGPGRMCSAAVSSVPTVLLTLILSHLHPAFFILWNMVFGDLFIIKWIYSNFLMCFLQGILLWEAH